MIRALMELEALLWTIVYAIIGVLVLCLGAAAADGDRETALFAAGAVAVAIGATFWVRRMRDR